MKVHTESEKRDDKYFALIGQWMENALEENKIDHHAVGKSLTFHHQMSQRLKYDEMNFLKFEMVSTLRSVGIKLFKYFCEYLRVIFSFKTIII